MTLFFSSPPSSKSFKVHCWNAFFMPLKWNMLSALWMYILKGSSSSTFRDKKIRRSNSLTSADMFRHFNTLCDCKLSCVSWLLKNYLDVGQKIKARVVIESCNSPSRFYICVSLPSSNILLRCDIRQDLVGSSPCRVGWRRKKVDAGFYKIPFFL